MEKRIKTILPALVDTYFLALEDVDPYLVESVLEAEAQRALGISRAEAKVVVCDTMLEMNLWE